MKRLVVFLVLVAVTALAFADDALVLPKGVIRLRATGGYGTVQKEFDADGEKVDLGQADKLQILNVGGAVEYGIVDGVNIALQWAPGYNVWSMLDAAAPVDKAKLNGAFDLFAGAKIQILGDQGFVPNDTMRFAVAPGVVIPLPAPDWDEQKANVIAGDDFIASDADNHAFGVGARLAFDYLVSKEFFVNVYGEFMYFLPVDKDVFSPLTATVTPDVEYIFGYRLTLEAEAQYAKAVGDGMRVTVGLPLTYVTTPELERGGAAVPDSETYSLSVGPWVALMLTKTPLPLEFEIGYEIPVVGKNTFATSILSFQAKAFLKF